MTFYTLISIYIYTYICVIYTRKSWLKEFVNDKDSRAAVFGHIGRSASEEVVINLVFHKCLPILLYGTEVCPVSKSDTNSLDFAINRFLMTLFKTNNINIIEECRVNFGVILPSSLITSRTNKLILKLQFL